VFKVDSTGLVIHDSQHIKQIILQRKTKMEFL